VFSLWFFSVHKVTYIYYAIISRVKYVAFVKLLVGRCSSDLYLSVGVGWVVGDFILSTQLMPYQCKINGRFMNL